MMTKKDFIALAGAIRKCPPSVFSDAALDVLADFCASRNSHFKRERWLDYIGGQCGPNGGRVKPMTAEQDSLTAK